MLDEPIIRFLKHAEPLMMHLAVSGEANRPYSVRGFGVTVLDKPDLLRVYTLRSSKLGACAEQGAGIIAGLYTDGRTNTSYQIKGPIVEHGPCRGEEMALALKRYREGSLRAFPKLYAHFPLSTTACDYVIYLAEEIFVQTPGPDAGKPYAAGEGRYDS